MLRELLLAAAIVSFCVVIHVSSIVAFAHYLFARLPKYENAGETRQSVLLIFVFAVLISLHLFEAGVWAGFYRWRGLFSDFETSYYFSIVTYSTIGYGDVVLPQRWRLLGSVEGIAGILLCGLSGAFIFAVVNGLFQMRLARRNMRAQDDAQGLSKVTVSPTRPLH